MVGSQEGKRANQSLNTSSLTLHLCNPVRRPLSLHCPIAPSLLVLYHLFLYSFCSHDDKLFHMGKESEIRIVLADDHKIFNTGPTLIIEKHEDLRVIGCPGHGML